MNELSSQVAGVAGWTFLDALGDGVYLLDAEGRCTSVNLAAVRTLGYARADELIGRNMHDLIHHTRPDGSPYAEADCPLRRTAMTGQVVHLEQEMLWRRDGTSFLADYSSYPMPDAGGSSGSVVVFKEAWSTAAADGHGDCTGAERNELLMSSPDCVLTMNADGIIVAFNAQAETALGCRADEIAGRELLALAFPPSMRTLLRERFARALADEPDSIGQRWEVDAARADGSTFPAEMSLYVITTNTRTLLTVHLRDITQRRRERALAREGELRFRSLADGIAQLSWMTEADGSIYWYNERWYQYTGTTFADMAGWGWRSVHHPDHLERVERRFRQHLESRRPWEDTFPLRGADGAFRWFLSRAMPIRDEPNELHPEGRLIGWFGTNTDITEIRDAEKRLEDARDEAEAANRAKSTFIANMSHELRTPLSAIIGYAEMLTEEIADGLVPQDLGRDVNRIESNARHLLGLINDVLDLSKVESGKMEAFTETFDVEQMTNEVAATVAALLEKRGNRLKVKLAPGIGTMRSDVTRVRQILLNLLGNAAKFTENGTIALSVSREIDRSGDQIIFAVADTGIGMSEAQVAKLFQRFHQADASTTRQYGGTGLGLALTKAFASLLGGTVEVSSTVDVGTTFTVQLPALLAGNDAAQDRTLELSHQDAEERAIVLVIDDDEAQRELTSRFLVREGFAARTAADGPTGLELARRLQPRAILLDVTMPGMDGWSVLSALKADARVASIPVVMVSFQHERALAASLGAADYVVKPVDWTRLRYVMERFREAEGDVLIIDDETDTRHRLRQVLERRGWSVVEAGNGEEGLDLVARGRPRVILLDLNMPVMDGFGFLKALRSRPDGADIPVVVLTALDLDAEDRRRLRGASQILNKGATPLHELVEKLRRAGSGIAAL